MGPLKIKAKISPHAPLVFISWTSSLQNGAYFALFYNCKMIIKPASVSKQMKDIYKTAHNHLTIILMVGVSELQNYFKW